MLGGEVDYDWARDVDLEVGGVDTGIDVDSVARVKAKLGYDLGDWLLYGTVGYAEAKTNNAGKGDGGAYGVGASYLLNDAWIFTGEYLYHDLKGFDGVDGADVRANTFTVRASYKF